MAANLTTPPIITKFPLLYAKGERRWKFQLDFIDKIGLYLDGYNKEKGNAALIKFPTEAGKTAIMAVVSNYLAPQGIFLVVVPSEALKSQLSNYLNERHWQTVG